MRFADKLNKLRVQNGLTQEQLAEHLHVARQSVTKYEAGKGYPKIETIIDIAKFFDVSIDYLLLDDIEDVSKQ